ncbi:LuxR family two component transcriptional regulator [Nocardiopsis sp. Huas11]|uniref:response regulator transcription factor n=1 Tax=Nocardiopsis sp. Huas11 TaxID=2183912 RepID=UPI000EB5659D|nr:response regulator transcription factor [Nocardiopsis sp. Huas11]RKS09526.1 LuxR family two component transcriptional regulator [Nocardiopsis sp. Huas11]
MPVSVLLVDDQPLVRAGFRLILESAPHLSVVGEASDGDQAVHAARSLLPDVVLMDLRMNGTGGVEATRRITDWAREGGHRVHVLALTTFDLDEYATEVLRAGATGFLLKDAPPTELIAAVETVADGAAVIAPGVLRRLLDRYAPLLPAQAPAAPAPPDPLTDREREVLRLVAHGWSNSEIADHLVLGETTVKSHLGRVLAKLGLRDRVQAVVYAYETGLVRPGEERTTPRPHP